MAYDNNRNGGRSYRDRNEPREMFKTVCSDCGKECEVPFKPTEGRPVYCRDCFRKHQPEDRQRGRRFLVRDHRPRTVPQTSEAGKPTFCGTLILSLS